MQKEQPRFIDLDSLSPELAQRVLSLVHGELSSAPSYMESYFSLKNSSAELLSMSEPDIDLVVPLVEVGLKGFQGCKKRIKQVSGYLSELNLDEPVV